MAHPGGNSHTDSLLDSGLPMRVADSTNANSIPEQRSPERAGSGESSESSSRHVPELHLYRAETFQTREGPRQELARIDTFSTGETSQTEDAVQAQDDEPTDLGPLIRHLAVEHRDRYDFWPQRLLENILTPDRIKKELLRVKIDPRIVNDYVDKICNGREHIDVAVAGRCTYFKLFAILTFLECPQDIRECLSGAAGFEVCDQDLPLEIAQVKGKKWLRKREHRTPLFAQKGSIFSENFHASQFRFSPHFFSMDEGPKARHFDLAIETVLPWMKDDGSARAKVRDQGAHGEVTSVRIHPDSHSFAPVLQKLHLEQEYFAVKELTRKDIDKWEDFKKEKDLLNRFNGMAHPHLVTLLATYQLNKSYHFIFPLAMCCFDSYWEDHVHSPSMNEATVIWLADQLRGLVGALDTIHNPRHLSEQKYGRHGDIKADNILCYPTTKYDYPMLVITDMGLSELNSNKSKSNIPGEKVPEVPGYRPPECDVEGGLVSRAFDIWTLGCLFFDIVAWFIGGWNLREQLRDKRTSINILAGVIKDIFYDVWPSPDGNGFVQTIKPKVTEAFDILRNHERCSEFLHHVLDIIQDKMLLILSKDKNGRHKIVRATSAELREQFDHLYKRCVVSTPFCVSRLWPIRATSERRKSPVVRVTLHQKSLDQLSHANKVKLNPPQPYRAAPDRLSLSRQELRDLDKDDDGRLPVP